MKFKILFAAMALVGIGGLLFASSQTPPLHDEEVHPPHAATVYLTPDCGCCAVYANYLRTKNYEVETVELTHQELTSKRESLGIPGSLTSCHTTVTNEGGYFVEGHIPFEAINQLLDEQPDVIGIGMPGMPSGSPGMPGNQTEPFNISQVNREGEVSPYVAL